MAASRQHQALTVIDEDTIRQRRYTREDRAADG